MELVMQDWEAVTCPVSKHKRKFRTCRREHCIQLVEDTIRQRYGCLIIYNRGEFPSLTHKINKILDS